MITWIKQLFCRHEYSFLVVGVYGEKIVKCKKCYHSCADVWTEEERKVFIAFMDNKYGKDRWVV